MKVLILQPWISYRGAEAQSLLLAKYLNRSGIEAQIACLYVDRFYDAKRYEGIRFVLPPKIFQLIFVKSKIIMLLFGFIVLFYITLRQKDFTVLNPHNLPTTWVCALLKLFKQTKVVWTVHGVPKRAHPNASILEKLIWLFAISSIDSWAVKKIDNINCVSKKVQRDVWKRYGRKSKLLYPGFEIDSCTTLVNIRKKYKLQDNFLLLHVSRLHPAKNVILSIQALQKILTSIPQARLLIIGEGSEKRFLEKFVAEINLKPFVVFTGYEKPENLHNYYMASDLVLVPYWQTEGCPLVPFEALLSERISVVSRDSGADELIAEKNFGMVCSPTVSDFSKAIIAYASDMQDWRLKAKIAKIFVKNELSGEILAKKFVQSIS